MPWRVTARCLSQHLGFWCDSQISVIMGPSAGGCVFARFDRLRFMVKNTSRMFITGPQVIKAVTGEEVTDEQLSAMTHNRISGVAHFAAEDEEDCFNQIKTLLSFLPSNNLEDPPCVETGDSPERMDESLNEIIPDNPNAAYDMAEVIRKIVDNGFFFQTMQYYAPNILTGYARVNSPSYRNNCQPARHIAGYLDINASDKAARHIRFLMPSISSCELCRRARFCRNQPEYGGIIRRRQIALCLFKATVPKITIVTRKAYGGSYLAMCSRDLGADQVIAWPGGNRCHRAEGANIIPQGD